MSLLDLENQFEELLDEAINSLGGQPYNMATFTKYIRNRLDEIDEDNKDD